MFHCGDDESANDDPATDAGARRGAVPAPALARAGGPEKRPKQTSGAAALSTSGSATGARAGGLSQTAAPGQSGAAGATGSTQAPGTSGPPTLVPLNQPLPGQHGETGPVPVTPPIKPAQPPPTVQRFRRLRIPIQPLAQLAQLPDLKACAAQLAAPVGHAECALGPNDEKLAKLNLAWDDSRPGGDVLALRLSFDAQLAPPLTELELELTRGWGAPALEQMRRDHDNKMFTLQWEDGERRATLEAAAPMGQPSRATAIILERKPRALSGDLASLRPRPFPNMRVRICAASSTTASPTRCSGAPASPRRRRRSATRAHRGARRRSYIGIFKLEPAAGPLGKKRWKPLWERTSGDEEDNDLQRILRVDTRDVTGDSYSDLLVELSCPTCGQSTSEVVVKTVRAGKAVDLLDKHDLYRASVDARPGQIRIREAEGDDTITVSTYAYDKSKGAFVLAREEREGERAVEER